MTKKQSSPKPQRPSPHDWTTEFPTPDAEGKLPPRISVMGLDGELRLLSVEQMLVISYLQGTIVDDSNGRHQLAYVSGEFEKLARQLLADWLRSDEPVNRITRDILADLFDPDGPKIPIIERELHFKFRKKGNRKNRILKMQIANHIAVDFLDHGQTEAAIQSAMTKYNLKRSQVFEIWGEYKDVFLSPEWAPLLDRDE